MSDLSKLDAFLHKTQIKVLLLLRLNMYRSIISLSKITPNVARSPIQPKKTKERAVGVWTKKSVAGQHLKNGGRQYRKVFIK